MKFVPSSEVTVCANPSVFFQETAVPNLTVIVEGLKDMLAMVTTLLAIPGEPSGIDLFEDLLQELFMIVRRPTTIIFKKMLFRFIVWVLDLIMIKTFTGIHRVFFLENEKHRAGLPDHFNFFVHSQKDRGIHQRGLR